MTLPGKSVFVVAALIFPKLLCASQVCATVVDPAGGPLPGAVVKIVSLLDTGKRFSVTADAAGKACNTEVPEGLYAVEASLAGFLDVRYYPVRVSFPKGAKLFFQLPIGEVTEGGVLPEAILSGTLHDKGEPCSAIRICLFEKAATTPAACTVTNDLGEYALTVPPGTYWLELSRLLRTIGRTRIDLSTPGYYRNKVFLPEE